MTGPRRNRLAVHMPMVRSNAMGVATVGLGTVAGLVAIVGYTYERRRAGGPDEPEILLLGIALLLAAVVLAGYRRRCVIDRTAGIEFDIGFWIPLKRWRYPLSAFEGVTMREEAVIRRSEHGAREHRIYRVRLEGRETLCVGQSTKRTTAFLLADRCAKHLGVPVASSKEGREGEGYPEGYLLFRLLN